MLIKLPNARAVVLASLLAIIACPLRGPLTAAAENGPPAAAPEQPLILVESVKPPNRGPAAASYGLTRDDLRAIVETVPGIEQVVPIRSFTAEARAGDRTAEARLVGTTDTYAVVHPPLPAVGRFLTAEDEQQRRSVAVLGHRLSRRLFPESTAVGETVRVGRHAFLIVGVLPQESVSQQLDLILPLATLDGRYGDLRVVQQEGSFDAERVELSRLELVMINGEAVPAAAAAIEALLAQRHDDGSVRVVASRVADDQAEPAPILTERARDHIFEQGVVVSGQVLTFRSELPGEQQLAFLIDDGSLVAKGDLLVAFDDRAVQQAVAQQKVVCDQARLRLDAARGDAEALGREISATIPIARLRLEVAERARAALLGEQGELAAEVDRLRRRIEIARTRVAMCELAAEALPEARSVATLERALELAEAQAELADATATLTRLESGGRKQLEAERELAVVEASAMLAREEALAAGRRREAQAGVAAAEAALAQEEATLASLEAQLAACRILAPRDGLVVHAQQAQSRNSSPLAAGGTVRQRQPLLTMPDLNQLRVEVRVHESQVARVATGQSVSLRFDALPQLACSGRVLAIGKAPVPTNWMTSDVVEYPVTVELTDPPPQLRLGMTAVAEITVGPPRQNASQ